MGFLGGLAIFAAIAFVLRMLRARYIWMDYVAYVLYLVLVAGTIYTWVSDSFWHALLILIVGAIILYLLFGIGSTTEIKRFGRTYSLECDKCDYGDLEIIKDDFDVVTTKCKRCGAVTANILNH